VEIASIADTTVVVLAPGMGDAIQAAKAGILEIADVFCVNKADRDGAHRTVQELRDMQRLGQRRAAIHRTVASTGEGIAELVGGIDEHHTWLEESEQLAVRRRERARFALREIVLEHVRERVGAIGEGDLVDELALQVAEREIDPYTAADRLLAELEHSQPLVP
ncbi:MAG: methylmalonyl Co-A mutase-associated GTPase MeaB, partial [Pseudonocardiaceae bacterium]